MHSMFLRLRPSPKMELLLDIYQEKYLDYRVYIRSRCKGNCNTHIYEFSTFTSGSSSSGNSVRSYFKNTSNDKKPHDFWSIQRVGKQLLHGTYKWRNLWFFLGNHFVWFSSPNVRKEKKENTVKSRNKHTRH